MSGRLILRRHCVIVLGLGSSRTLAFDGHTTNLKYIQFLWKCSAHFLRLYVEGLWHTREYARSFTSICDYGLRYLSQALALILTSYFKSH